jgi:hypothetical protein
MPEPLCQLDVINYGLAGRMIEVRFPNGDLVCLVIPESEQERVRSLLRAIVDSPVKSEGRSQWDHLREDPLDPDAQPSPPGTRQGS